LSNADKGAVGFIPAQKLATLTQEKYEYYESPKKVITSCAFE